MEKTEGEIVYWMLLDQEPWHLHLGATEKGLCYVGSQDAPFTELSKWAEKHLGKCNLVFDEKKMAPYKLELSEYLNGQRQEFSLPIDLRGTEFQQKVWDELEKVPYAQTVTYTELAENIGRIDAVRAVGAAIGANPVLIVLPCHRMMGKHGEWRGYRGGLEMKARLLELEQ